MRAWTVVCLGFVVIYECERQQFLHRYAVGGIRGAGVGGTRVCVAVGEYIRDALVAVAQK